MASSAAMKAAPSSAGKLPLIDSVPSPSHKHERWRPAFASFASSVVALRSPRTIRSSWAAVACSASSSSSASLPASATRVSARTFE